MSPHVTTDGVEEYNERQVKRTIKITLGFLSLAPLRVARAELQVRENETDASSRRERSEEWPAWYSNNSNNQDLKMQCGENHL